MKIISIFLLLTIMIFTQNAARAFSFSGFDTLPTLKVKKQDPSITSEEYFNKLRTTYIPGIYCQQKDDFGGYRKQKHYFYNTKKEQLIEIPDLYYIDSTKQLGLYKREYELYGAKSNKITYKGKTYTIMKF